MDEQTENIMGEWVYENTGKCINHILCNVCKCLLWKMFGNNIRLLMQDWFGLYEF